MEKIIELLCSLTGADPAIIKPYIAQNGLARFLSEHDGIAEIPPETHERIDELYLFVREVEDVYAGS